MSEADGMDPVSAIKVKVVDGDGIVVHISMLVGNSGTSVPISGG